MSNVQESMPSSTFGKYLLYVQRRSEEPPTFRSPVHSQWPGSPGHSGPTRLAPWSPATGNTRPSYIQAPLNRTKPSHELQTSGWPERKAGEQRVRLPEFRKHTHFKPCLICRVIRSHESHCHPIHSINLNCFCINTPYWNTHQWNILEGKK